MPETASPNPTTSVNQVYSKPGNPFNHPSKNVIIAIVVLLLVGAVAYVVVQGRGTGIYISREPSIEVKKLPVTTDILTNPIFYQWRASFQGKLIAKKDNTFTVEDKGTTLVIEYVEGATYFFDKKTRNEIKLEVLPIGSKLLGGVWIFDTETSEQARRVVGDAINVEAPTQ